MSVQCNLRALPQCGLTWKLPWKFVKVKNRAFTASRHSFTLWVTTEPFTPVLINVIFLQRQNTVLLLPAMLVGPLDTYHAVPADSSMPDQTSLFKSSCSHICCVKQVGSYFRSWFKWVTFSGWCQPSWLGYLATLFTASCQNEQEVSQFLSWILASRSMSVKLIPIVTLCMKKGLSIKADKEIITVPHLP